MNTSHKWTYYTVMFAESLTRAGLIKFIFCNQYCSLVVYDINFHYYLIFYISRDGTSTGPNSITFHLSFLSNTVSNTLIPYGVIVAQADGHAYLYPVLRRRSRLVLSFKVDQDQLKNQKEEEEHDHREF